MGDIFELIPEEERPYRWAYQEMMMIPREKPVRLSLDSLVIPFDMHCSLFHAEDPALPDIYRAYWYSTDSVLYYTITNYEEIRKKHPEIVKLLENCGRNAYEREWSRIRKALDEGVSIPDYPPLSLFLKKPENQPEE